MAQFYLHEEFPTYGFSYNSVFGNVDEYVCQNEDVYGDDPDVVEALTDMMEYIDDNLLMPFFDFMHESNGSWHYYEIVDRGGAFGYYGEYDIMLDVVSTCRPIVDYSSVREAEEEAQDIRDWLDTYPSKYGFHYFTEPRYTAGGR